MTEVTIINNRRESRYEAAVDGHLAELTYRLDGDELTLIHTGVPPAIERRGIGSALVKSALLDAKNRGLKVVPRCPFVARYIRHHPEYLPLVAERFRPAVENAQPLGR